MQSAGAAQTRLSRRHRYQDHFRSENSANSMARGHPPYTACTRSTWRSRKVSCSSSVRRVRKINLPQHPWRVEWPTSGDVLFGPKSLVSMRDDELTRYRREHVGFVFQFASCGLTARENVELVNEIMRPAAGQRGARRFGVGLRGRQAIPRNIRRATTCRQASPEPSRSGRRSLLLRRADRSARYCARACGSAKRLSR